MFHILNLKALAYSEQVHLGICWVLASLERSLGDRQWVHLSDLTATFALGLLSLSRVEASLGQISISLCFALLSLPTCFYYTCPFPA